MFYAIGILLAVVIVIVIFAVRMTQRKIEQNRISRAKSANPTLPVHDLGPRPTMRGVAREVFGQTPAHYTPYGGEDIGVNRAPQETDNELPSYGANNLPARPDPVYSPRRHEMYTGSTATLPVYSGEAPPKYN